MPELPEVETIKNDLKKRLLNKKIKSLKILFKKIVKSDLGEFRKIINYKFISINRMGKLLIFELSNNNFLLIHLKMTGQLVYQDKNNLIAGGHSLDKSSTRAGIGNVLPNKYTHVIFEFSDNSKLYYNDLRKFGYLKIVDKNQLEGIKSKYGPEPLNKKFNFKFLKNILTKRKTSIKAVLLNQQLISGIGNIYADEILFKSGIKPNRKAKTITDVEIKLIIKFANQIIKKAIKYRGTTFSDYIDSKGKKGNFSTFLSVYGREGQKCLKCRKNIIKKAKIAQRGTHYCSKCQK